MEFRGKTMATSVLARSWYWMALGVMLSVVGISNVAVAKSELPSKVFYRYVNDKGVKVLHHTIPPLYAQKGYEIVSLSGKVVKVVPPALSAAEVAAKAEAAELAESLALWDKRLRRRYSSIADINAAKRRKLADLDTNIAIIHSNISTKKSAIKEQQDKAANIERSGREVPKVVLNKLTALENELEDSQEQVRLRLLEYQEVVDKYDRDKVRFEEISVR